MNSPDFPGENHGTDYGWNLGDESMPPMTRGRTFAGFALAVVIAGPAGAAHAPTAVRRLVVGVRADVTSLNVYTAASAFDQEIADLLYPRLAYEQDDGVAWVAHVGGFVAGMLLVRLFENPHLVEMRTHERHRLHPDAGCGIPRQHRPHH